MTGLLETLFFLLHIGMVIRIPVYVLIINKLRLLINSLANFITSIAQSYHKHHRIYIFNLVFMIINTHTGWSTSIGIFSPQEVKSI